jgi:pSer/pThr/pTyr-binding forkhead associated (FHA) protein
MPAIIKVIEGPDTGAFAQIGPGETVVGKGTRAALRLSSPSVSVEHLVITQHDENMFVENLSARGTLVNDTKISGKVKVRLRDKIRVSEDTVLRIETEGGDSLLTQHRKLAIVLAILFAIASIVFVIADPFTKAPPPADWDRTQAALGEFISREESLKRYPPKTRDWWDAAWRHDNAGDYRNAVRAWQELQTRLQLWENAENRAYTDRNLGSLNRLLRSSDPEGILEDGKDPELGRVAVAQFVNVRYKRAAGRSGGGGGGGFLP